MPVNIVQRKRQNSIGDAIMAGLGGFTQGQNTAMTNALNRAKIEEYQRKSAALNQPLPRGYERDMYSGKALKVRGQGGGIGLPNVENIGDYQTSYSVDADGNVRTTYKPLSGDTASKYESGKQGAGAAQTLIDEFGFRKDRSGKVSAPNFLMNKLRLHAAQVPEMPGAGSVVSGLSHLMAGDKGKMLDLALETLAKDVYRSETGAAGNEAEIQNVKRRLITKMTDSEKIALDRIMSSSDFVRGVAESIKPGTIRRPTVPIDFSQMSEEELEELSNGG